MMTFTLCAIIAKHRRLVSMYFIYSFSSVWSLFMGLGERSRSNPFLPLYGIHGKILCKYVAHFPSPGQKHCVRFFSNRKKKSFFLLTFLPSIYFILLLLLGSFLFWYVCLFFIAVAVADVTVDVAVVVWCAFCCCYVFTRIEKSGVCAFFLLSMFVLTASDSCTLTWTGLIVAGLLCRDDERFGVVDRL